MKPIISVILMFTCCHLKAQDTSNLFIITTDGLRWQEIFNGADSLLINDIRFVKDTALLKEQYWCNNKMERRKKMMPFFWNTIMNKGQLFGNREFDNNVDAKNIYRISYPGYNEIFTGYADPFRMFNKAKWNHNENVLDYLDQLPGYKGKIAVFSSWNIFPYIFNSKRRSMAMNSGFDHSTIRQHENIQNVQQSLKNQSGTRHDQLTYLTARDYIEKNHPRVVFIGFGQTDEYAHTGRYDLYIQQANNFDKFLSELWYYIQTDPFYKDNTTLLITTDHGRGNKNNTWMRHNTFIPGSGQAWIAMLGKKINPLGEIKTPNQLYLKQIASTIADLLGEKFVADHPVAGAMQFHK